MGTAVSHLLPGSPRSPAGRGRVRELRPPLRAELIGHDAAWAEDQSKARRPRSRERLFPLPRREHAREQRRCGSDRYPDVVIRSARPDDTAAVIGLIRDLAQYERARDEVANSEEALRESLFGEHPSVFCHVVDHDGSVGGFALWYLTYSTWLGRHGIYLEDLYVRPELRGKGYGRALLRELARIAAERGYGRMEWAVLNWNEPAIDFYRGAGAEPVDGWTVYRLSGQRLRDLATRDHSRRGGSFR